MILWCKTILANDFMLEKDLGKLFYGGKGFWQMIYVGKEFRQIVLWKRIWLNDFIVEKDFGKWIYEKGFC